MDKPEDIPQDLWARADKVLGLTFLDSPMHFVLQESIARAILKAKEDEREAVLSSLPDAIDLYRFLKSNRLSKRSDIAKSIAEVIRSKPTQC